MSIVNNKFQRCLFVKLIMLIALGGEMLCWSCIGVVANITGPGMGKNVTCVADPLSPTAILRNSSLTYWDRVAFFDANANAEQSWRTLVSRRNRTIALNASSTVPPPIPDPQYCPQLYPFPIFTPGQTAAFLFEHSRVPNVLSSMEIRCGIDCSGPDGGVGGTVMTGTPSVRREVIGMENTTRLVNRTNSTTNLTYTYNHTYETFVYNPNASEVYCAVTIANTTSIDAVCIAYVAYNDTYSENGTIFATVGFFGDNSTAQLDPLTTTLSAGMPSAIRVWLPPQITECPWYVNALSASPSIASNDSDVFFYTDLVPSISVVRSCRIAPSNDTNATRFSRYETIPLVGGRCQTGINPTTGQQGAMITGNITPEQVVAAFPDASVQVYEGFCLPDHPVNWSVADVRTTYFLPPIPVGGEQEEDSARIMFRAILSPSNSSWWPFENYSSPALAHQPRRCYATSPLTQKGTPTTLFLPTLTCSAGFAILLLEVINDTAFCCTHPTVPSGQSVVDWGGFIDVFDTGKFWFTDTAGIVATPSPRPVRTPPPAGNGGDNNGSGGGDVTAAPGAPTSTPPTSSASSSDGADSQSSSESTAMILGACMIGIGGMAALMVLLYFKWWRPRELAAGGGSIAFKNSVVELEAPLTGEGGGRRDNPRRTKKALQDHQTIAVFDEVGPTEMDLL